MGIERLYADGIEQAYQRGLRSPAPHVDPDFRIGSFLAAGMGGIPSAAMETLGSVRDFSRGIDEQYRASPRGQIVARELERRTGVAPADQPMMPGGEAQRMKAREFGPDPQTAHMADQVFHGLTRFGAKAVGAVVAAGPIGGAALLGSEEANTIYRDLIGRGIDSDTALKVAAVQGAISAAGVVLPISGASMAATTAGKVGATAGLVAAGGPGAYVAQETLARDILQRAGYADEAAKHDPTDPLGLAISAILPAAFGGVALRGALRNTAPMPSVKTEAGVRQAVQLTPEEQAASAEFERSAGNLAELRKEIARQKDPALRQILEAELATQTQAAANAGRGAVAESVARSPEVVDAARVKVLQETVQRSLPESPDAYPRLMEAIDSLAAGERPVVEAVTQVRQWQSLAEFVQSGKWKPGDEARPYPAYEGPDGFLGWVRSQGGIALAEKYDITGEANVVRSNPGGIFRNSGLGRDELARRAADAGYMLPDEAGDSSRFVDLLQGSLMRGERALTLEQQTEAAAWGASNRSMDDRITDLEGRLRMLGEDPSAARGNPEAMEAYLSANQARLIQASTDDAAFRAGDESPEMDALRGRAQQIAQDIRDTDRTLAQFEAELQPLSPVMRRLVQDSLDALNGRRFAAIERKGDFLSARVEGGQVGGTIKPDGLHINFAELDEAARGQGIGVSMYSALIDEAHARGLRVFSDSTVEMPAVRVYEALERRGYDLRRTPGGGELPPSDDLPAGAMFGRGAKDPVFEVLPRNADAPPNLQAANPEAAAPARGAGIDAPPGAAEPGLPAADVQAAGVARTVADQERQIVDAMAVERPDMMVTLPGTNEAVRLADAVEMIRAQQAMDESDAALVRAAVLCDLSP